MQSTDLRESQAGQMLLATGVVLLMSLLSMAISCRAGCPAASSEDADSDVACFSFLVIYSWLWVVRCR